MTLLLEKAIERIERLPQAEQDEIAARILADLETDGDERWEQLFAETTDEQWDKLLAFSREDAESGEDMSLDDFLAEYKL